MAAQSQATVSEGEEALAFQLKAAKIPFRREVRFDDVRKWRFDFVLLEGAGSLAVEVEGGAHSGGHKRHDKADDDCEKHNAAVMAGWKVYRFTPAMVDDGRALATVERALGRRE